MNNVKEMSEFELRRQFQLKRELLKSTQNFLEEVQYEMFLLYDEMEWRKKEK